MTSNREHPSPIVAAALLLALACSSAHHARRVDQTGGRILSEGFERTLGSRRETVLEPETLPPAEETAPAGDPGRWTPPQQVPPAQRRVIPLGEALELATAGNRDFLARKENLFLQALGVFETRWTFTPILSAALSALYADGNGIPETESAAFSAAVSQILDGGGTLSLGLSSGYARSDDDALAEPRNFDSSLSLRLVQPLLRGAGYVPSHEPLTQAERGLVYAIRDFELFSEDFSIDVARRYYDLVQQRQSIENVRRNLEDFVFSERQSEALFNVGRTSELDVLRARRSRLNAENDLIEARESYQLALDRFAIFLGLRPGERVEVREEAPVYVPMEYERISAVRVALANRLDLLTLRERVEDAERAVRIARNGMLPALDLDAALNVPAGPDPGFSDQGIDGESVSVGLSLELPVNRVFERGALRRAQIALVQTRRALEQFEDNVVVEIESAFRELTRRSQSLAIQRQLIFDQEKNVRIAQLRFERGEIPNRDVVEAQQSLLDARNSLIREQVNYEISRLRMLRNLGILFIDEKGMWVE